MMALELAFWAAAGVVLYTYLGYGVLLWGLVALRRRLAPRPPLPELTDAALPALTLVIAAHDEEAILPAKLANTRALDYPAEKLRVLFVTDGSTDRSPELLRAAGFEVLHRSERAGKPAAINRAMRFVTTPIVVFSDANTELAPASLRELVRPFADPAVGAVAGEKRIRVGAAEAASGAGEGLYWRYESALKRLDSELHTVVGAAGELFALRTELWEGVETDALLDDFLISMRIAAGGRRVLYEPRAVALEAASASVGEERKRKVRIAAGGFQSMARLLPLLNPLRHGWLSFQYLSHRVLRWAVAPFLLPFLWLGAALLATVGNPALDPRLYAILTLAQTGFHLAALAGWHYEGTKVRLRWLFVPFYFDFMNLAALAGCARWLRGRQTILWERAARATP